MSLAEYNWEITDLTVNDDFELGDYLIINDSSGGGTFAPNSSQATVTYIVGYNFVEKFLDSVLGKTVKVGATLRRSASDATFGSTNGSTPEEHPYWYSFFASTAEVIPKGKPTQQDDFPFALWDKAYVTVVFRPNDYNIVTDDDFNALVDPEEYQRFTSKVPEGQCDLQTTLGFFRFVTDANHRLLDTAPTFAVPSMRTVYTWKQIPAAINPDGFPELGSPPNMSKILLLQGSVNSLTFDGYAPGTVLFVQAGKPELIKPAVATANNYYWDIPYILHLRDYGASTTPYVPGEHIGWNYAYDPLRAIWDLYTCGNIITGGTILGKTQYPYADLNALFAVSW